MYSSELLTSEGWKMFEPDLPIGVERHCMVLVNNSHIMLIGGKTEEAKYSGKTYFLNLEGGTWEDGPVLNIPRNSHACGMLKKDSKSNEV